ncbi:hypothetical protein [Falsiphaeobacter marinintestinus]|uniref:hypothetical protein n=1 Tax=Falsiphaeobacter marinintestinus TaxID=1492905 RepID=UPI0011B5564E|nr:hypothetical protein [Phaeobacter marinintestinus]
MQADNLWGCPIGPPHLRQGVTNAACEQVEAGCGDDLVAAGTGQSPVMVAHYTCLTSALMDPNRSI